jgi:hypothetical protein
MRVTETSWSWRVAEAQIDLQRVRQARHQFLSTRLKRPSRASSSLAPDPHELANIWCKISRRQMQWTGTSGGHCHAEDLLFGHSMLATEFIPIDQSDFWQNEAN